MYSMHTINTLHNTHHNTCQYIVHIGMYCQYLHVAITDVTIAIIKLISRTSTCGLVLTPGQSKSPNQRNSDGSVMIQDSVSARLPLASFEK